jgi:tol-pal system protein YbgF
MKHLAISLTVVVTLLAPNAAFAADKTHQQIMAELRMLQEQQSQLAQLLGNLADTLKTVTTKIDDQGNVTRKAFADQKLLVDGIAEGVRILREKADDTNVRLSSMTQELEALRQTISSMPAPAAPSPATPVNPNDPAPTTPATTTAPPPVNVPPPTVSAQKAYEAAFADYVSGQYDLAIQGFEFFLKQFPKGVQAAEAQLNIGNSYYAQGNYRGAVDAFNKVIADFGKSPVVSTAYYKLGLSYEGLKMIDRAKEAYQTVIKNYPEGVDVQLARQRLEALNRRN